DRPRSAARARLLLRPGGGGRPGRAPVPADQGPRPARLLPGVQRQPVGRSRRLRRTRARHRARLQDLPLVTMKYRDLRDFPAQLEARGELKRVAAAVDPRLEMTEICARVLQAGGPALLFEKPKGHALPVLGNLFGTVKRVALGMGIDAADPTAALRDLGKLL